MNLLATAVSMSEEAGKTVNTIPGEPWMYGLGGFAALLVLLIIVTRLNIDR